MTGVGELEVPAAARRWLAVWSGRDPDAFAGICAANVHYEDPLTRVPLRGAGELGEHAERMWEAFPDLHVAEAGPVLTAPDHSAIPARMTGTHRGGLGSLPATGRSLDVRCVFFCELRDGRLARVRAFFDLYDAARQLAVVPEPGSLSERALLLLRGFGLPFG